MAFYYPDGDGGRRVLDTGGDTTIDIDITQRAGALIFRGTIKSAESLNMLTGADAESGDVWTIGFTDAENNLYTGDLLIYNGEDFQVLGTSPQRPTYSPPTASESVKGGVIIGDGLQMDGDKLNVSLPTASNIVKGCVKVGYGLAMSNETLVVTLQGAISDAPTEYGKVITVPTTTSALPTDPAEIEALDDWVAFNTATYSGQNWSGDIVIILPTTFAIQHYTITHIHNEGDYSVIYPKESFATTEEASRGYEITSLEGTRYILKIPAVAVNWQEDSSTEVVIHGTHYSNFYPYSPGFVPGEGLTLVNNVLTVTLQPYELPTMSESVKGGAEVGNTLVMTGDKLNVALGTTPLTLEGSMWLHDPANQGG